jgi:hypothetical protein
VDRSLFPLQKYLQAMSEDELVKRLVSGPQVILRDLKLEWNRRHPEDPILPAI